SPGGFFSDRIDVGQHAVTLLDKLFSDRLVLRTMNPNLLIGAAFLSMVAINGIERSKGDPPSQQVRRRAAAESANVVADVSETGDSQAEQIRNAHSHVVPCTRIIAGPRCGVSLPAGVGGTSEDERPLVSLKFEKPLVGGAGVLHPEYVVDGPVIEFAAIIEPMHSGERHGFIAALKKSRLVHVIPESGDAHSHEVFI